MQGCEKSALGHSTSRVEVESTNFHALHFLHALHLLHFSKKIHLRGARDHVRPPIPLTPLAKCLNLIGFWGRLSAQLWLVGERAASALPSGSGNLISTYTFVSVSGNLISTSTFAFLRDHAQDSTHTRNSVHFHLQSGDWIFSCALFSHPWTRL